MRPVAGKSGAVIEDQNAMTCRDQNLLPLGAEMVAVEGDPCIAQAAPIQCLEGMPGFGAGFDHFHVLPGQAPCQEIGLDPAAEDSPTAILAPGLRQSQAAHHVPDSDRRSGVGPKYQCRLFVHESIQARRLKPEAVGAPRNSAPSLPAEAAVAI